MSDQRQFKIALSGELGIRDVYAFKEQLSKILSEYDSIEIDVGDLKGIDISFVQVILSAHKTAARNGRGFLVSGPPGNVLTNVLERGGFVRSSQASLAST